jgi:hypothetical protein
MRPHCSRACPRGSGHPSSRKREHQAYEEWSTVLVRRDRPSAGATRPSVGRTQLRGIDDFETILNVVTDNAPVILPAHKPVIIPRDARPYRIPQRAASFRPAAKARQDAEYRQQGLNAMNRSRTANYIGFGNWRTAQRIEASKIDVLRGKRP